MKKILLIAAVILVTNSILYGQDKYFTKTGLVSFAGKSTLSKINAENKAVAVVLDIKTGALKFSLLAKGFEFSKALMQKHFNEKYIESDKFPKSDFTGVIANNALVKYGVDGDYPVTVKGKLSIHGETKDVEATGTIRVNKGRLIINSTFYILIPDYKINAQLNDKVAITVDCSLERL